MTAIIMKEPLKIALLVNLFTPKWLGGTEIATYHIAKHLALRGHEVHVITSWDEGQPNQTFETGFYIHRLPRTKSSAADYRSIPER